MGYVHAQALTTLFIHNNWQVLSVLIESFRQFVILWQVISLLDGLSMAEEAKVHLLTRESNTMSCFTE